MGDAVMVELDGKTVINTWSNHDASEPSQQQQQQPGAHGPTARVMFTQGKPMSVVVRYRRYSGSGIALNWNLLPPEEKDGVVQAAGVAKAADVAIVVVGESQRLVGEDRDRANFTLTGLQLPLIQAVVATGTPTVVRTTQHATTTVLPHASTPTDCALSSGGADERAAAGD